MTQKIKEIYNLPKTDFSYIIYKNPSISQVKYYDWVGGQLYYYKESGPLFKWTIGSKFEIISGFKCQNAFTTFAGRKFEAWFAREIPVSDGPYKFYGLPGLIIKVYDSRNQYKFELTKLNIIKSSIEISLPAHPGRETTKKELERGKVINMQGTPERMAALGSPISPEMRRKIAEKINKQNNPLELK